MSMLKKNNFGHFYFYFFPDILQLQFTIAMCGNQTSKGYTIGKGHMRKRGFQLIQMHQFRRSLSSK